MDAHAEPPRVTVVIPCYNQAEFLAECLQSVVAQTFRAWEAIVVDDASTRGDPESVVQSFGDLRIRCITHPRNLGLGPARNTGFGAAACDLVLPLDSDDKLDPRFLEVTVAALDADPTADCVFTDFQLFGASDEVWRQGIKTPADMLVQQWIPGPGTLMRKRLWNQAGGYPDMRGGNEDWDFWIAAVQHDLHPLHIPRPLYLYRRGSHSMSVAMYPREYAIREGMYRRHRPFFARHTTGGRFLAEGYLRSARAVARGGQPFRATYLFARYAALWPKRILDRSRRALARSPSS